MRRARLLTPLLAALALVGCGQGEPVELAVGDCLIVSGDLRDVPVVPCDGPHEAEVYALVDVADAPSFDEQALITDVQDQCVALFDAYVGEPYRTSSLDIFYQHPLQDAWDAGERGAVCAAFVPDPDTGRPLSFEGSLAADPS